MEAAAAVASGRNDRSGSGHDGGCRRALRKVGRARQAARMFSGLSLSVCVCICACLCLSVSVSVSVSVCIVVLRLGYSRLSPAERAARKNTGLGNPGERVL